MHQSGKNVGLDTVHGRIAADFADALSKEDFEKANSYVLESNAESLKKNYLEMIEYGDGPVTDIELMGVMEDWPAKQVQDLGWAYVSMCGAEFSEAVTVIVSDTVAGQKITNIEWGRP